MKPPSNLESLTQRPGPSSIPAHLCNRRRTDRQPVSPSAPNIASTLPFPWRGIQAWVEDLFAFYDPPTSS